MQQQCNTKVCRVSTTWLSSARLVVSRMRVTNAGHWTCGGATQQQQCKAEECKG
jgi:hypothetical protein